jgi:hypothetical protein
MLLKIFVHIPFLWSNLVYGHTQSDKWVCGYTYGGILIVRVVRDEYR